MTGLPAERILFHISIFNYRFLAIPNRNTIISMQIQDMPLVSWLFVKRSIRPPQLLYLFA